MLCLQYEHNFYLEEIELQLFEGFFSEIGRASERCRGVLPAVVVTALAWGLTPFSVGFLLKIGWNLPDLQSDLFGLPSAKRTLSWPFPCFHLLDASRLEPLETFSIFCCEHHHNMFHRPTAFWEVATVHHTTVNHYKAKLCQTTNFSPLHLQLAAFLAKASNSSRALSATLQHLHSASNLQSCGELTKK